MSEHLFAVSGLGTAEGIDPLGVWQIEAGPVASFAAWETVAATPAWYVVLPETLAEAQAVLADRASCFQFALLDLERVKGELESLVAGGEIAYAATSDELSAYRAELLKALHAARAYSFEQRLSVGLLEDRQSYAQWVAFVEQVEKLVGNYAHVETVQGGRMIGRTAVSWMGDFDTWWRFTATAEERDLHRQAVHLALESRMALVRVATVVVTGAFEIAAKAGIPGAQVLLLPAVWRFVRDVLAELRKSWPQLQHGLQAGRSRFSTVQAD
jgi:hypothetical protein